MNCKKCGGNIKFEDGKLICENCNMICSDFQLSEKIDVFICYNEYDDMGRRTQDSIIANKIYNNLEANKITAFFDRISLDGVSDEVYEIFKEQALFDSKMVIMFGCSKNGFQKLLDRYYDKIRDKKILPIFFGFPASDLPQEIKNIQALNYDTIGADNYIIKNVINILGKEQESDLDEIYNKKLLKKKKTIISISLITVLLLVIIAVGIIISTHELFPSNKYSYAQDLIKGGENINAIAILSEISDYKDSKLIIENIQKRYDGLYEDADFSLDIKISGDTAVEIVCIYQNKRFNVNAQLEKNLINFSFRDNDNAQGNGVITLEDSSVNIKLYPNNISVEKTFQLNQKKDRQVNNLSKEKLLSWLSGNVTIKSLEQEGYHFEYKETIDAKITSFGKVYMLKEYPIEVFVSDYFYENEIVSAISAPAGLLAASHIGESSEPFLENGYFYAPNGTFPKSRLFLIISCENMSSLKIENDTPIYVTTEYLTGNYNFKYTLDSEIPAVERTLYQFYQDNDSKYGFNEEHRPTLKLLPDNTFEMLINFSEGMSNIGGTYVIREHSIICDVADKYASDCNNIMQFIFYPSDNNLPMFDPNNSLIFIYGKRKNGLEYSLGLTGEGDVFSLNE